MTRQRARIVFVTLGLLAAGVASAIVLSDTAGADASDAPPLDGCHEVTTQELYVQHAYACEDGTRVVTFASEGARDDYLKVAEYFGSVTVARGDRWARIR